MQVERSYRGWIVAMTVAGVVTYFVLAVERDFRVTSVKTASSPSTGLSAGTGGIRISSDPSIAISSNIKPAAVAPAGLSRNRPRSSPHSDTAKLLNLPPEPVAVVTLHAPTAIPDMVALSMSDAQQSDNLVSAIDKAFDAPIRQVALQRPAPANIASTLDRSRLDSLIPNGPINGQIPEPVALLRDLATLRGLTSPIIASSDAELEDSNAAASNVDDHQRTTLASTRNTAMPTPAIMAWAGAVDSRLRRVVFVEGLLHSAAQTDLAELLTLTADAQVLITDLDDQQQAARLGAVAYGVERRVRLWQAVSQCLQNGMRQPLTTTPDQVAREELLAVAQRCSAELQGTTDADLWRSFLQLDAILKWSADPQGDWQRGNALATQLLTRLTWERLTAGQTKFLSGPMFQQLAEQLRPLAAQPIDFRQLLADVELLEDDPINRCRVSLAHTVQTLRVSPQPAQRAVAQAINDHYRNANIRIAVSGKLLDRMMPSETFEARPVRQRILGAETQGNSQVRTQLNVRLIPDATAWHLELGLVGDLESDTRSSKGPAVFHQTSIAKINSTRTLRMDPSGVKVSADPTNVDATQFLNGMSTDLDRLPVVGDFFRVLVREQFEQQRGVAQRITRRLIAEETDEELDKQLKLKMSDAESQLQHTFIGPLERLQLNPIVVSMQTSEERLTVRYRVASEGQMAAHTARPRAPGDSLVSMQIHQSAINNALAQLGLSERAWTLPELCDKLAAVFDQSPWTLPDDVPKEVTVRFAPTRPVTVELRDGKLELTLRIAELSHPERRMNFQRFIIKATYVPVASGMDASLVREGVVSVDGPRLSFTEKVPLRGIFGTVFSGRSSLSLIHSQWREDPRAAGLAVSQVEVRDGWLSVAVSEASSPHAARVAAMAQDRAVQ